MHQMLESVTAPWVIDLLVILGLFCLLLGFGSFLSCASLHRAQLDRRSRGR